MGAAQGFLAEGRTAVSIQELTEAAAVGFGSFYNHFESKEALFEAALEATLTEFGVVLDELVSGIEDPAEIFAASFRLVGRLREENPEVMRLMLHSGPAVLLKDLGLRPRARHDLEASRAAGRIGYDDLDVAFMIVGSMMLGMLQLLDAEPGREVAATTDAFAAAALRTFGMSPTEAAEVVGRPLPPMPRLTSSMSGAQPGQDA